MDTYSLMRAFADSWALLLLMLFFLGVVAWAYRPGSRRMHDEIARSILRPDNQPLSAAAPTIPPSQPAKEA